MSVIDWLSTTSKTQTHRGESYRLERGPREGPNVSFPTLTHDRPKGRPPSQGTVRLQQMLDYCSPYHMTVQSCSLL